MSVDGNRVLVVDDDAGLVRALAINLRAHGWDVTVAMTGAEALDAAASARPDVILLDLGLPDLSGFEVIAGVRGGAPFPSWCSRPASSATTRSTRSTRARTTT